MLSKCFPSLSERYVAVHTYFSIKETGSDQLAAWRDRKDDGMPETNETNEYGGHKLVWGSELVTNKFADISFNFCYAVLIFLGQCCLFFIYVVFMNENPAIHHNTNISVMKWIVGTVIMIIHRDESGAEYVPLVWMELHKAIDKQSREENDNFPKPVRVRIMPFIKFTFPISFYQEIWIRQAMSFIVNSLMFTIIVTTAPVLLSTLTAEEFIVDCVALLWLTKIDDCKPKKLEKAFEDRKQADRGDSYDDMKSFYYTINKEKCNASGKEACGEGGESAPLVHGDGLRPRHS